MKLPGRRSPYLVAAGALSILLALTGAWSQTARTVKIVVPYPAGGTADILARILGEQISRAEGVTLLTENRPGASAVIGTEAVSRAAPDGSTLLITSTAFLIAPHLTRVSYDPLTSFEPICQLVSAPIIVVVNSGSPYRTLADWLNAARAKPGSLTLASIPGGLSRIAFEMLKRAASVDIAFIPLFARRWRVRATCPPSTAPQPLNRARRPRSCSPSSALTAGASPAFIREANIKAD